MRQCAICHKASIMVGKRRKLRGKYNPVNWQRKQTNLQYLKIGGTRRLVCSRCRRTVKKTTK